MSDLVQQIERVKTMENAPGLNERNAQTALVFPLLRALGWDTTDPDEVVQEHPVGGHLRGHADIVLMSRGKPLVLLETKAPVKGRLDLNKNLNQLSDYCRMLQIELGILTNGIEWHFYLAGPQSANPALSDQLDLMSDGSNICANKLQQILSRDKVSDTGAQTFARKAYIKRTIDQEWSKLLSSGDSRIVSRLRVAVKEALGNMKVSKADLAGIEEFVKQQAIRPASSGTPQMDAPASSPSEPAGRPKVTHGKVHGDESPEFEPSGKAKKLRPTHIEAFGERYEAKTWKEVLLKYASAAYLRDPGVFHVSLEQASLKKPPLFIQSSAEPEQMRKPRRISDSDLWVEVNLSSPRIRKWCRDLQELLHLEQESLRVYRDDTLLE